MENGRDNYWWRRASRRRFLGGAAAGGAGLAALAVAGCGDDDTKPTATSTSTTTGGGSATSTSGSPTADQPKQGGTYRFPIAGLSSADPPTIDPFESLTFLAQVTASAHYSRLLMTSTGPGIAAEDFTKLEGDLAVGLPEQPNDVTYIFKFRPNIKYHDKAPLNGRAVTAQDFQKTYENAFLKSQNSDAWKTVVDKVEATDASTLKITLKQPYAAFLTTHASHTEGAWLVPIEIIDSGQVKKDPVGTGPWVWRQWETGVAIRWDRHPNYHIQGRPLFDKLEASLNKDPQRIITGLAGGNLDSSLLDGSVYNDAHSKLDQKGQEYFYKPLVMNGFLFNFDIKPWQDKRVRQALSMAMDRDACIKVQDQTGKGEWMSHISPALAPYYISPKDATAFGPNAKYFQKNITEAKALLSAAGYPDGISFKLHANVDAYGAPYQQQWELLQSTIKDAGFKAELDFQPYASWIQSTYLGKFTDGAAVSPLVGSPRDPDNIFYGSYATVAGRRNWGGTPIPEQADLDARFAKQRQLIKPEERIAAIKDIQKVMAESMLVVPTYAGAGFGYAQPWVKNYSNKIGYATIPESIAKAYFTDDRLKKG